MIPASPGWMSGPRFDLAFIVLIPVVALAMAGTTVYWPDSFFVVLAAHALLFSYTHLIATYSRLLWHPEDRARHRWLLAVPPLVLLGLWSVGKMGGLAGIYTVYFVGQLHHTVRQSWGIAQRYRRAAGGMAWDAAWLSEVTMWSVPVWGLLHRAAERPTEFLYQPFWLPPVPGSLVNVVGVASAGLWGYWLVTRIAAWRRGELPLGHTLYLLSHLGVYLVGYGVIEHLCSGWLLVNVWHNAQYVVFVWMENRRRFAAGIDPAARALSWMSQAGAKRAGVYFLALAVLGAPLYFVVPRIGEWMDRGMAGGIAEVAVPAALLLVFTMTFHHYWVDAVIWKRPRAKQRPRWSDSGPLVPGSPPAT